VGVRSRKQRCLGELTGTAVGGSLPAGRYRVSARAFDKAGNESRLGSGPSTLIRVKR
jgi:hypothetical protein